MPSLSHDSLVWLFRNAPELASWLLRDALKVPVPAYSQVTQESIDFTDVQPAEYRADAVSVLRDAAGRAVLVVVDEVQLRRDATKRFSWPVYVARARATYKCDAVVLVLCSTDRVARWAAEPIDLGYGSQIRVLAIGPSAIPAITDPKVARRAPELALLSARAYGHGEPKLAVQIVVVAALALRGLPDERSGLYLDMLEAGLSSAVRKAMENALEGYKWQGPTALKAQLETKREDVLRVLELRDVLVLDDAVRVQVLGCDDLETLDRWHSQAIVAGSTEEALG